LTTELPLIFLVENRKVGFQINDGDGGVIFTSISKDILNLDDKDRLVELIILYNEGKSYKTIRSWLGRLNHSLLPAITSLGIKTFPTTTQSWQSLIAHAYAATLSTQLTKSKITTRVRNWNSNCRPFLQFIKDRDAMPLNVIIPRMKRVGELKPNSSFKVQLIGQKPPKKDLSSETKTFNKILTPISLHRTDAEYLDEVRFDLERKRNKLFNCLKNYWYAIKSHHDYGIKTVNAITETEPERMAIYEKGNKYTFVPGKTKSGKKHVFRFHIADPETEGGFGMFLFLLDKNRNGLWKRGTTKRAQLPLKELSESNGISFFPDTKIEEPSIINPLHRLGWCMGLLTAADVSYLVALLMMQNPKWTFESLLEAKVSDLNGKPNLFLSDLGMTFSLDKRRASSMKQEILDDLSLEIFNFLHEIRQKRFHLIQPGKENYLFLTINKTRTYITTPRKGRVIYPLSGYNGDKYKNGKEFSTCLSSYFPSLNAFGLGGGTTSHTKIRHTEGVIEWFKTGSIKAVSKKLGNSKRVAMTHYLPKSLFAAWSTRLVRRHQNLLITAATSGEEYQLEAIDFSSLIELDAFLVGILSDNENKSPLLEHLRKYSTNAALELPDGNLNVSLSETSLTALYTYRDSAKHSSVPTEALAQKDPTYDISPLAFINLANHLEASLPTKQESHLSNMHYTSLKRSRDLVKTINWSDMFVKIETPS